MEPATVRFIGDENNYIHRCDDQADEVRYCHQCEQYGGCNKKLSQPKFFSYGQEYEVNLFEYFNCVRDSIYVTNDINSDYEYAISIKDFEIVSDPDNVVNHYEAIVKCNNPEYNDPLDVLYGKRYKATGMNYYGEYLIMDELGFSYFYPKEDFLIVKDPHGILSRVSMIPFCVDDEEGILIGAHNCSANHKPELQNDKKCGCFFCGHIYDPKEIKEWIKENTPIDRRGTALCPYCGIDSVIGECSGYPITPEFLQKMHDFWFGDLKA